MKSYRCECGETKLSTTDAVQPCMGCDECGTTFAQSPKDHRPREPHDWKPQFNRNTGEPDRPYCRRCYTRGERPAP